MNKMEKKRILVVDDDETVLESIARILKEEGYDVDTAENGSGAIKKSSGRFYNLALIDIRLPDMEGTKLLTAMRETTPRMIKIIITGYPSLQNAVEAVNKGADGYIVKPVKVGELLKVAKDHLKRQEEAADYGEEKVKGFVETRAREKGYDV